MKSILFLSFFVLLYVSNCNGSDLIVGTSYNSRLVWQHKIDYMAFPFKKRVKEVFYTDPGQQIIRGVIARETDKTGGLPTITAGGVGYTYVNMRFKSERGNGLYYNIEIYV